MQTEKTGRSRLVMILGSLVGVAIVVAVPITLRNALDDSDSEFRAGVEFAEVMNEVDESSLSVTRAMTAMENAAAEWAAAARELGIALESWKPGLYDALSDLGAIDTGDAEGAQILRSYEQCLRLRLEAITLYCKAIDDDGAVIDLDALLEADERFQHAHRIYLQVLEALPEQADGG